MDSPFATPLKLPCGAQLPNALFSNTGSDNSAIVPNALFTNIGGSNNTAIGRLAEVTGSDLKNAIAIGYNAKVNASNTISVRKSAPNTPFICSTSIVVREQLRANQPPDSEFSGIQCRPIMYLQSYPCRQQFSKLVLASCRCRLIKPKIY